MGHFEDPFRAAMAYDRAVLEYRGDKAVTNFPVEQLQQEAQPPDVIKEGGQVLFHSLATAMASILTCCCCSGAIS